MHIEFQKLRWKNFLQTGNQFIEIQLNRSPSTLIVGPNGAGKSTMIDALSMVLFDKPFRNVNKKQLVNSINNKDCVVECEFKSGSTQYLIRRGIKPNVFEIHVDGKLLNQDSKTLDYQHYLENQILKFGYKAFTQVIVVGKASYVPFMDLKAADRREVIEDLLDIQIFSAMGKIVKERISETKTSLNNNAIDRNHVEAQLVQQRKFVAVSSDDIQEQLDNIDRTVEDTKQKILVLEKIVKTSQKVTKNLEDVKTKRQQLNESERKLAGMDLQFNHKINEKQDIIEFCKENDNCPTCMQGISVEHKQKLITKADEKINTLTAGRTSLQTALKDVQEKLELVQKGFDLIQTHLQKINSANVEIRTLNQYITSQLAARKALELKAETRTESNDQVIKELTDNQENLVKTFTELQVTSQHLDVASLLLKDSGIKTKIIDQYLPLINKYVNQYLGAMNFHAMFELDSNFSEVIKSRYRDEFSYNSFSEGQKLRISLAILFTWREIARLKNKVNTNLLILDEVFDSSLDEAGAEDFVKILRDFDSKVNNFVVSHRGDFLYDKFHNLIQFETYNNFSRIKQK
jgi:DNA repair exonuclease SbcCD ATPase subunit